MGASKTKTTSKEAATKGSGGDGRSSNGHGPGGDNGGAGNGGDGSGGDSSNGSGGEGNTLLHANDASKTVAQGSIGLGLSPALPDAMAATTQIPWPPLAATDAIRGNETTTAEAPAGETESVVTSAGETSVERGIGLRLGISRPLVVAVRP